MSTKADIFKLGNAKQKFSFAITVIYVTILPKKNKKYIKYNFSLDALYR